MENTPTCCNKPMESQMVPRQVGQKIDEMETWRCTVCQKTCTMNQPDDDQPIDPDLSALPPD
jgi:rubrerythrin